MTAGKVTRRDLRPDVIMLAWTEASGANVTDVLDLGEMALHASFVMPDGKRFFSDAELKERGSKIDFQTVKDELIQRDENDSTRALAPLKAADDAIHVDATQMDADAVVEAMAVQVSSVQG